MKVDKRYHCFGCQADGDVIDFTARFFSIKPKEAALKLAEDFGINHEGDLHYEPKPRVPSEAERFRCRLDSCYHALIVKRDQYLKWQEQFAPKPDDSEWDSRFVEAVQQLPTLEEKLDILLSNDKEEQLLVVQEHEKEMEDKTMESTVKTPVYHETAAYAREHGELEQYRNSHWTNIACKNDIEDAIARNFDGMHLNKECVSEVLDRYGSERVSLVLAATVQTKAWDGRFSNTNKDWAFSVDIKDTDTARGFDRRDEYAVGSHPAVLDGFINLARKEMKEREQPSLREQLQEAQVTAPKPAARKRSVPER